MDSSNKVKTTQTRVSFRIAAPGLDPDEITRNLGLTPDHSHHEGEHPRGNPKYAAFTHGMWSLDSKSPREQPLESHLNMLLNILEPQLPYLLSLPEQIEIDFYSTIFGKNGFQLSPQIISRIANLGAGLGVTVYPGEDEIVEINQASTQN